MRTFLQFLASTCFFLTSMCVSAQEEYELLDFPQPGMVQVVMRYNINEAKPTNHTFFYEKDTLLCGKTYQCFRVTNTTSFYTRYEAGKVYQVYTFNCNHEYLQYDFSVEKGDSIPELGMSVDSTAIITMLYGQKRKWIELTNYDYFFPYTVYWIDGIGNAERGFFDVHDDQESDRLICHKDSSGLVHQGDFQLDYDCDSLTCPYPWSAFSYEVEGSVVSFTNNSRNSNQYEWNFSDGSELQTTKHPIHDFEEGDCYEVCLTVFNDCPRSETHCKLISVDMPEIWQAIEHDIEIEELSFVEGQFVTEDIGWVITSHEIYKTMDGGETWIQQTYPEHVSVSIFLSIDFLNEQQGIIGALTYHNSGGKSLLITKNGGETWEDADITQARFHALWVNEQVAYSTGTYGNLLKSENGGNSWKNQKVEASAFSGHQIFALNEDTVFMAGLHNLYLTGEVVATYNGGELWEVKLESPEIFRAVFARKNHIWAATELGSIFKSSDMAATWDSIGNVGEVVIELYFLDDFNGWAVGSKGIIYQTNDGGETWQAERCVGETVASISFPSKSIAYAVTSDGLILTNSTITSIKNQTFNQQSIHAFPNPFTDHTSLQWNTRHSKITCQVFDAYGRLVKTIEGENVESLKVDRAGLADGLYFYKVFGGKELLGSGKLVLAQ
ncbi:MAG: YCF48-related protein [Chitinophagales bacterium]